MDIGAAHCGPFMGVGLMGFVGSGGGVLLGSGGQLGGVSWDGVDLMQHVNNLPIWIRSRVFSVGTFCSFIPGMDVLCRSCFFLVWGIAVFGASLGFVVSSAVFLARKFRAGFNILYFIICVCISI